MRDYVSQLLFVKDLNCMAGLRGAGGGHPTAKLGHSCTSPFMENGDVTRKQEAFSY